MFHLVESSIVEAKSKIKELEVQSDRFVNVYTPIEALLSHSLLSTAFCL